MSSALFPDPGPRSPHHKSIRRARKHIPHALRPSDLVVKRNQRERNRVNTVNQAFVHLRNTLPVRDDKLSKMSILKHASIYIQYLSHVLVAETSEQLGTLDINKGTFHSGSSQSGTRFHSEKCKTEIICQSDTGAETYPCRTCCAAPPANCELTQDRTDRESRPNQQQHHCAYRGIHPGQCSNSFTHLSQADQTSQSGCSETPPGQSATSTFTCTCWGAVSLLAGTQTQTTTCKCHPGRQDIKHIIYQWNTS